MSSSSITTPFDGVAGVGDTIEVRINEIRYAARDTNFYTLRRPDGRPLPPAESGAHIDLFLPSGLVRQYSLVHPDPRPMSYTIGVKRDPASTGGSAYLHERIRVGELVRISAPRNNFPLDVDGSHDTVLIAGGIGITPIWSMVECLRRWERPWQLYYSCRSRADAVLLDQMADIPQVVLHFDDEAHGQFLDIAGIVGRAPAGTHFYCCGPTPMLDAFADAVRDLPDAHVHVEYFSAKEAAATGGGYVVQLAGSGAEYPVSPGMTILETLREAGLDVPSSCEQGICGTCETRVLSGTPDHRDAILSEAERAANDTMMICCSGSLSERLVLDM